jgi:hypothetical protein
MDVDFDIGDPMPPPTCWPYWKDGWLYSSVDGSMHILDVGEPCGLYLTVGAFSKPAHYMGRTVFAGQCFLPPGV